MITAPAPGAPSFLLSAEHPVELRKPRLRRERDADFVRSNRLLCDSGGVLCMIPQIPVSAAHWSVAPDNIQRNWRPTSDSAQTGQRPILASDDVDARRRTYPPVLIWARASSSPNNSAVTRQGTPVRPSDVATRPARVAVRCTKSSPAQAQGSASPAASAKARPARSHVGFTRTLLCPQNTEVSCKGRVTLPSRTLSASPRC